MVDSMGISQISSALPICHAVPVEILLRIFMTLSSDLFDVSYSDVDSPEFPPRFLSQVCTQWRTILLDYPPFWAKITLTGTSQEEWLNELIHRTREHPLDIRVHLDTHAPASSFITAKRSLTNVDHILQHIARVRSLALKAKLSDLNAAFARILTPLQAPLLEQWELERYRESGMIFDIAHDTIPFPIHAPRLACLQTRFYPLFHSGMSGTIRELEIEDARVTEVLVATNYLGVLVELPALERIDLKTFQFQPSWWQPLATPPMISLPHLKRVTLHGYRDLILLFLSSVQAHPNCLFNLHLGITTQCGRRELEVLGERIVDKMKTWHTHHVQDSKFFISVSESDANHFQIVPCSPNPSPNTPSLLLSVHKDNTHNPKHVRISYLLGMFYRMMKSIHGPTKATIAIAGDLENSLTQGGLIRDLAMPSVIDLTLHNPRPSSLADIYSILRFPSRWLPAPNLEILRFAGDWEIGKYWGKEDPPGQTKSALDTMLGNGTAPLPCPLRLIDVSQLDHRCPMYEALVHSSQTLHQLGVELQL